MLTETLSLAHPMIPFVTEEIYDHLPGVEGLLAGRRDDATSPIDEEAEAVLARTIEAVQAVRHWRDYAGLKAGAWVNARVEADGYEQTSPQVAALAELRLVADGPAPAASVPIPGGAVEILPGGDFDPAAATQQARRRA